jgi:hypothetical protein
MIREIINPGIMQPGDKDLPRGFTGKSDVASILTHIFQKEEQNRQLQVKG